MIGKNVLKILLLAMVVFLKACISIGDNPSNQLIGKWQSNIGGFPVVTEYDKDLVTVGDNEPVAYQFEDNQLTFIGGNELVWIVSFPDRNLMVQADPLTGSRHEFTRISL